MILKSEGTRKIIADSLKILARKNEIDEIDSRQQKIRNLVVVISSPVNWDTSQIVDANVVLQKENKGIQSLVTDISSGLATLESKRSEWEKQKTYWQDWSVYLGAASNKALMEVFDAAHETIKNTLEELTGAITGLLAIQDRASKLLDQNIRLSQMVQAAFSDQRSNIFKKTEKSFFSRDFLYSVQFVFLALSLEQFR